MELSVQSCLVGKLTKTECHKKTFSNLEQMYNIEDLSNDEKLLLKYRVDELRDTTMGSICHHHLKSCTTYYSLNKKYCCDPLKIHKMKIQSSLRIIDLNTAQDSLKYILLKLIPGDKYCKTCQQKISSYIEKAKREVRSISINTYLNQ